MMFLLFLSTALAGGLTITNYLPIGKKEEHPFWCKLAAGIGIGYLVSGWITYLISYLASVWFHLEHPKIYGNTAAIIFMLILSMLSCLQTAKQPNRKQNFINHLIKDKKQMLGESICFGLLFAFLLWSMFYVFHVSTDDFGGSVLESGVSVYSDYAPHTAMIRSFAWHDNFPTQYPHYGGADVKYHFMFQFLAGNLEFLGMRIDWAFNLISAASLWGFLVLLYYFTKEITGKKLAGMLTILFFFCRSSFAGVSQLFKTIISKDWTAFWENTTFLGYTIHEDWGLWNYNVFLNQRHLGFGLLIAILVLMYFADYLNILDTSAVKAEWFATLRQDIKNTWGSKAAWTVSKNWKTALVFGCMLGGLAFWNGAVTIATLLILFGFALFSNHKLDYAITAGAAISLSVLQKKWFICDSIGRDIGIMFRFGFLAEKPTIEGVWIYLTLLSGLFFFGILFALFALHGKKRVLTIAFFLPVVFAFTISMTPDVTVNHKYVIISTIFLNIIWADMLAWLFQKKWSSLPARITAILIGVTMVFLLTVTGAYDLLTIYNKNQQTVSVDRNSPLTEWLKNHITETDLILTGEDSMSETTLSGSMLYNGWPYYAWSAGYDTSARAQKAIAIYTTTNTEELTEIINKEHINYILYREGMTYEEHSCTDETISQVYPCVYQQDDIKIYKTTEKKE